MPIDFPSSPANNASFTSGDITWVYNSSSNSWRVLSAAKAFVQDTPPTLVSGALWYDSLNGKLYIGADGYWVEVASSGPAGPGVPAGGSTGDVLVKTSATDYATGWTPLTGTKNAIINGGFDIWQRGSGAFTTSSTYSADRWLILSSTSTVSVSREAFALGNVIAGYEPEFYLRMAVTGGTTTASSFALVRQLVESVRTFAGQTVTLSFWAKADAAKNMAVSFTQDFGSGGTAAVGFIGATTIALTTSWARYAVTTTLPSISGKTIGSNGDSKLIMTFWGSAGTDRSSSLGGLTQQSGTFDFWGVQLERGAVATALEQRPIQQELALCQRYYEVQGFILNNAVANVNPCANWAVPKRKIPALTLTAQAGTGGTVTVFATGYGELTGYYQNTAHSAGSNSLVTGDAEF